MGHSLGAPAIARIAENLTSDVYQNMEIIIVDGLDNPGKLIPKL
ncbi:MAG: hypothetical protein PG981_000198 [Wolbachia endosymbiont of Ctenocephalides orientis wCori]|nr:MAG: hypothetical protein PG981_000198 [Wolbachia endosymbiont of Ctenocephalides orientis wCori]